ncbi:MAG: Cobalamin adenosyltransferase [Verrucomicrobiae bacterium]|nr:Cobalamin adenosyltransferase [Verrucomicrobiae bacterium]
MLRLTKIYTRTGDKGETGLVTGERVSKDSARLWAFGTVDELNSAIGVARSLRPDKNTDAALAGIQNDLFDLGAELAGSPPLVRQEQIDALEKLMDRCNAKLGPLREFILPGGTPVAAQLHVARTICRRAERYCVRLKPAGLVVPYLNRLGDALFVLARWMNYTAGKADVFWVKPQRASRRNAR